jgi:peptidoglycan/xylan/chitin deacetylase (PgdA/CDA1 family)
MQEMGVPCTFFVVPDQFSSTILTDEFSLCLRHALDNEHELSLHGYRHIKNEFGLFYPIPLPFVPIPSFGRQRDSLVLAKDALRQLAGIEPIGFRSPFYLYNDATFRALSSLNFRYDSSKSVFKPTHGFRWRVRWSRSCRPHRIHNILEIPVIGDYTFSLTSDNLVNSITRALGDFDWIKSCDGVFVMNVHPNRTDEFLLDRFLRLFIEKIRNKTEFIRLQDVESASGPVSMNSALF